MPYSKPTPLNAWQEELRNFLSGVTPCDYDIRGKSAQEDKELPEVFLSEISSITRRTQ